jgi:hypothetical protein
VIAGAIPRVAEPRWHTWGTALERTVVRPGIIQEMDVNVDVILRPAGVESLYNLVKDRMINSKKRDELVAKVKK